MLIFSLCFLFTLIVRYEMNKIGKIIFAPLCVVGWVVCIPMMVFEFIFIDILVLIFAACTSIGIDFAFQYMLFPLYEYF